MRQRGSDGVDRSFDVDVDHLLEVLGIELQERPVRADAGVGDQDVETAETVDRCCYCLVELTLVAHVADEAERLAEAEVVTSSRREGQARALSTERAGDSSPDPGARTCDERHLSFQSHVTSSGRRAG
jgi:hypothetical protein